MTLKLANNQTITWQISDIINFDSHHPTKYSVDILDLPLYYESDKILEPKSHFEVLPPKINPEIIHGQQSGSPQPELNIVEDEVDI